MFAFFRNESKAFCDNRDLDETEKLIPDFIDFKQWLKENKDSIPL